MHGILYPRYHDNLLISVIYFSLKENEVSGYYLDNCESGVDPVLSSQSWKERRHDNW